MIDFLRFLIPTVFALVAIALWISAIPMAYRIEKLKAGPDAPKRSPRNADMISAAFGAATLPEVAEARTRLRRRLLALLCVIVAGGVGGYLVRLP